MKQNRITFEELDGFILDINLAQHLDQILEILQKQIKSMGFDYFTYWLRWPSHQRKEPVFISTYPQNFIDHYVSNDFQSHDLVGRRSLETHLPFSWSEIACTLQITRMQEHLFDASRAVGMASGASVPIHGPKLIKATFSVTNDWSKREFEELFQYHRHQLQILATYAHERIMQLGLSGQVVPLRITQRETDILTWSARGKTCGEIGVILNISEKTVKNHMQKVFSTLGVHTIAHATSKAITYGLIIP